MPGLEIEVIVFADGAEFSRHALGPGSYTLGRASNCAVQVDADSVSRQHARLTIGDDGSLLLEDLGSSHGTLLDGEPITAPTSVAPSQSIQLGDVTLILRQRVADTPVEDTSSATADGIPTELREGDRYQPGQELARGGMGAVLVARQPAIRRQVAMKVMLDDTKPHARMRFIEEAQITGQLEHPNIIPVHELAIDDRGQPYYTMKLVKGITLKQILDLLAQAVGETIEIYPLAALLTIFQKVCDAIAFAHSKAVIHRDLKPANLMVGKYGEVLVMDWGLAKVIGTDTRERVEGLDSSAVDSARQEQGDVFSTMDGSVVGSPQYMAPEQARGEVDTLDARGDIYALGAILFHILALRSPIKGRSVMEIVDKAGRGETIPLSEAIDSTKARPAHLPGGRVPESLEAVVRKAMAFDREARYPQVEALQADIAAYQNGFATSAEKAGAWRQFTLFVRRNRAVSIAAAAGLAVLVCVSAAFTLRIVGERNAAVAARKRADDARKTAELEKARADNALTQAESEKRRAEDALNDVQIQRQRAEEALTDAQAQRQRAEKALVDYKTEQNRADAERGRADTESHRANKALGDVKTQSNRAEAALADLKKTAPTFFALAKARLAEGQYAEAFEQIGYAIRLDGQSADYVLFRAQANQVTRKLREAVADYQCVLVLRPGDKVATASLAVCQRLLAENRTAAADPMPGLISWWKADGDALDSAGVNHGTLLGGAIFRGGRFRQAFFCDGKTACVSIPRSPTLELGQDDFTIALWVNFTSFFGQQAFLASGTGEDKWAFQFIPGHLQFLVQGKAKAALESAYFGPVLEQWYHIAISRGGGTFHFYVNGAELSSEDWSGSVPATAAPLVLGHAAGRFFFSGLLDDVRLYSRSLTLAELRVLAVVPSPAPK